MRLQQGSPFRSFAAGVAAVALATSAASAATIDAAWRVIAGNDPLAKTAADDLRATIAERHGVTLATDAGNGPAIVIGTVDDHPLIAAEHARNPFTLDSADGESYALRLTPDRLFIVGARAKGAMNGAFRFLAKRAIDLPDFDEHASPAFKLRVAGHKMNQHPPADWSDERQARYYAEHYINVVWGEKLGPPMSAESRRKYGLGLMIEQRFPPGGDGWMNAPAHASAVFKLSADGDRRVVSPFDPVGRQAYLDGYKKLFAENPDVRICYAVFADYNAIPGEKSVHAQTGQPFGHTRAEAMIAILDIMKEAIGDRPIEPAAWLWHGFFGDPGAEQGFMKKLAGLGYAPFYNEHGNDDCWLIRRDNFNDTAALTGPDGKTAYGPNYLPLVSIGGACESINPVIGFPTPQVAAHKLGRLHQLGVRNFITWWAGYEGWVYQPNNEIVSELIWNPKAFDVANPTPLDAKKGEASLRALAERDFGKGIAPQIVEFWRQLDDAVITSVAPNTPMTKMPAPETDGLHLFSWFQRMGVYSEPTFGNANAVPLTPADALARKNDYGPKSWMTKPGVAENYAAVLDRLDKAVAFGRSITVADEQAKARLADMVNWTDLYRHLLRSQHQYIRAMSAIAANPGASADSPALRKAFEPITRDAIANCESLLKLIPAFKPNFNIQSNMEMVWDDANSVASESRALEGRIDTMRSWLAPQPNLAEGATATSSSNESDKLAAACAVDGKLDTRWGSAYRDPQWLAVRLARPVDVAKIVIRWNPAFASAYELQASENGTDWTTIHATEKGVGGTDVIRLAQPTRTQHLRVFGKKRGSMWGYSIAEFQVFGPAGERN